MKKIYTLAGVLMVSSVALSQNNVPLKPANSTVHAGHKYSHSIKAVKGLEKNDTERGTPYISEDFEMGFTGNNQGSEPASGSWMATSGPGSNVNVNWETTTVGHANDAGSTFTIPALNSTTGAGASGTWALLDSDSDGVGGSDEENFLTSPTYDLTSVTNNSLALEWQQFFAEWTNPIDDTIWLEVSTDGTNWSQLPSIDDGVGRDNRPNPEVVRMDLTSFNLAGESTVQFRFHWKGQWNYGWQLDDIELIDLPPNNIRLNTAFVTHNAVHPAGNMDKISYTKIPDEQVFDMEMSANVINLGANAQTNVVVNATSTVGAFSGFSPMIGLNPSEDSTLVVSTLFNPGTNMQSHTVNFLASYDNVAMEDDPNGLIGSVTFEVTDAEYSRDNDDYNGAGLWNGEDASMISNPYEMGHAFQIETTDDLEGISCALTASTDAGVLAYASIYEVDPTSGDFNLIAQSSDVEVKSYNIPAAVGAGSVQTWFPLQATLNGGTTYLAVIGHYGGPDALVIANSTTVPSTANTTFLYDPTATTGGPWFFLLSTPMVRAHFSVPSFVGIDDEEVKNFELFQNQPNPSNGVTNISYQMKQAGKVNLSIVDVNGKVVANFNEGVKSAGNYSVDFNTSELSSGIYNYSLTVNGQRITKRMVITK